MKLEFWNKSHTEYTMHMNSEYRRLSDDKNLRWAVIDFNMLHPVRDLHREYLKEKDILRDLKRGLTEKTDIKIKEKKIKEMKDELINLVMIPFKNRMEKIYILNELPCHQ